MFQMVLSTEPIIQRQDRHEQALSQSHWCARRLFDQFLKDMSAEDRNMEHFLTNTSLQDQIEHWKRICESFLVAGPDQIKALAVRRINVGCGANAWHC